MSTLRRYNPWENAPLDEILTVLEQGVDELKGNIDTYTNVVDPYRVPEQYLRLMLATLGINPPGPGRESTLSSDFGLTEYDQRAVLIALGWAYHFKGANHGLRLIARALWRYATLVEDYKEILEQAESDPSVEEIADWPDFLAASGHTTDDLLRITINLTLDVEDARRYGELQTNIFRQLLSGLNSDTGFDRIFSTYRPGFSNAMSTTLGTSQFDETSVFEEASLLYGNDDAFIDPGNQAILASLKWNIYPKVKIDRAQSIIEEFIPAITHVVYDVTGYKAEDTVFFGASEELSISTG
jgi:hypothetical protein